MKKLFESPTIEITYFDEIVKLEDASNTTIPDWENDGNTDDGGWV